MPTSPSLKKNWLELPPVGYQTKEGRRRFFSNLKVFFPNKTLSARGVSLRREAIRKKTIILFWPKIELFALLYLFYCHNHGKHFLTCSLKQFTLKIQNSLQFFFSFLNESFFKRVSKTDKYIIQNTITLHRTSSYLQNVWIKANGCKILMVNVKL